MKSILLLSWSCEETCNESKKDCLKTVNGKNHGELGRQLPLIQFDKTRKFSVKVGNFVGGIETRKWRTTLPSRMRRVFTWNCKQNSPTLFNNICKFTTQTFLSKTRRMWFSTGRLWSSTVAMLPGMLECVWGRRSKPSTGFSFKIFLATPNTVKMSYRGVFKASTSMLMAGKDWTTRIILWQGRGSMQKKIEKCQVRLVMHSNLTLANKESKTSSKGK